MTFTDKRALAAECFRRIAEAFASAPERAEAGMAWTPDDLLEAFHQDDSEFRVFTQIGADGAGGYHTVCLICNSEAHASTCPLEVLDTLRKIGIGTPKDLPAHIGLTPRTPKVPVDAVRDGRHLLRN